MEIHGVEHIGMYISSGGIHEVARGGDAGRRVFEIFTT